MDSVFCPKLTGKKSEYHAVTSCYRAIVILHTNFQSKNLEIESLQSPATLRFVLRLAQCVVNQNIAQYIRVTFVIAFGVLTKIINIYIQDTPDESL